MNTPLTRPSLIARLTDRDDAEAWEAFHAIYQPLLERLLRQWGLQSADASEVIQEVFSAVTTAIEKYEARDHQGAFRGWLAQITRHKMVDLIKSNQRFPSTSGGSDFLRWLNEQPASESLSRWDIEHHRAIFRWAAERVRKRVQPQTWEAFFRTAVQGQTMSEVAQALSVDVGWIYVARSRVLTRLRETVSETAELTSEWRGPSDEM